MEKVETEEVGRDTRKRSIAQTLIMWIAGLFFVLLVAMAAIRKFAG